MATLPRDLSRPRRQAEAVGERLRPQARDPRRELQLHSRGHEHSDKTFHPFTWHMSHYDPFTRTSRPYHRTKAGNGDPIMKGATWTVRRLRPHQSLRISFTLPFRRHNDPKSSNFAGEAIGTHDVVFVKP
jgi:hypothetical protein